MAAAHGSNHIPPSSSQKAQPTAVYGISQPQCFASCKASSILIEKYEIHCVSCLFAPFLRQWTRILLPFHWLRATPSSSVGFCSLPFTVSLCTLRSVSVLHAACFQTFASKTWLRLPRLWWEGVCFARSHGLLMLPPARAVDGSCWGSSLRIRVNIDLACCVLFFCMYISWLPVLGFRSHSGLSSCESAQTAKT